MQYLALAAFVACLVPLASADTPANCTYNDLIGRWKIYLGPRGTRDTVDCTKKPSAIEEELSVTFTPLTKVVKDKDGEMGFFTLIYNQGFELDIGHRKFFAFFQWEKVNSSYSKFWCNRTMYGWEHDTLGREWSCILAVKQDEHEQLSIGDFPPLEMKAPEKLSYDLDAKFVNDMEFIDEINRAQSSWVAGKYDHFETMTNRDILQMAGKRNAKIVPPDFARKLHVSENSGYTKKLPESFDWRNVNGVNYVSPVRNQGQCGSCYTFASTAMLEARVRIATNNTQTPVFSTQEVVSCGVYSQGCEGGFPYLVAGKYGQDFGLVEEDCYPYQGKDGDCKPAKPNCRRHYVDNYWYVGGYYGACTEEKMKLGLVLNGPIAVGFEVYPDFMQYKSGVYHHVFSVDKDTNRVGFNPFELTNHAVLVVGYGADQSSGEKYWIVKNSWGTEWGENGFFRIRRGNDECGMESLAVEAFPVTDV